MSDVVQDMLDAGYSLDALEGMSEACMTAHLARPSEKRADHPMGEAGLKWADYTDSSDDTQERCDNCSYWEGDDGDQRDGCAMFRIDVNGGGVCREWEEKR